jgi:hypothetical protein
MMFKDSTGVIFLDSLIPKDEGTTTFKTSGTARPMTQCHITEDFNPLAPELFLKFLHTLYLKCE